MRFSEHLATILPDGNKRTLPEQYLKHRPHRIFWDVVAPKGAKLSVLQESDLVFDKYDLKIRKLI